MKIGQRIVDLMLTGAPGQVWTARQIAGALDVRAADVTDAINALRYSGKVEWLKLKLTPSMWIGREEQNGAAGAATPETAAPVGEVAPIASPTSIEDPADAPVVAQIEAIAGLMRAREAAPTVPAAPVERRPSLAEQVHAEAVAAGAQRRAVRALTSTSASRIKMPLREAIDREFLAEPTDALSLLRRRWPDLLDALVDLARERGQPVAEAVHDVIEGGLERLALEGVRP